MSFLDIGRYSLTSNWVYTPEVEGELIKVRTVNYEQTDKYLKAVVALAFNLDNETYSLSRQLLSYSNEDYVFTFHVPHGIDSWSIGLKRLDNSSDDWTVDVSVFETTSTNDNFVEQIASKVTESMLNFVRLSALSYRSSRINIRANQLVYLLGANPSRASL